jgi:hypothetical protein
MSEPLEVLRGIWRSQGQIGTDLGSETKSCKRMDDAGVSAAWRARLEREGKLAESGGTVRDLILGADAPVAGA